MASTLFILCKDKPVSGGYGEEDTPVPIPNTEVKLLSADGTALATGWESRSPPGFILKPLFREGLFYFGLRISDCGIIVLRFVRCQWSVVRSSKNKGRGKKGNLLLLHALCSMPYATLLTPDT